MGRTDTAERAASAPDVASALADAAFVRLVARADGDALAASAVLARALDECGVPFQVSVGRTTVERDTRLDAVRDDATAVVIGSTDERPAQRSDDESPLAISTADRSASVAAWEIAREFGSTLDHDSTADQASTTDHALALAGVVAAGHSPEEAGATILEAVAEDGQIERRPGVATPTADLVDGLAHSTLFRSSWSGDETATRAALEELSIESTRVDELNDDGLRRVASLVALDVTADGTGTQAAIELDRVLRPHVVHDAPFETVAGYADVLCALARTAPGTAVALALGQDVRSAALDEWRAHSTRVHAAIDEAYTGRYDGLFVVRVDDAPVVTTARLVQAFRSPEPRTLAIGEGAAAIAITDADEREHAAVGRAAADRLDAEFDVGPGWAYLSFDVEESDATDGSDPTGSTSETDASTITSAVREVL